MRTRSAFRPTVGGAKLKPDDVCYIRRAVAEGVAQSVLGTHLRVHSSTISRIVSGGLWTDLT